ncbi:MAG: hypothetical protein FKGGLIKP_00343 [Sodalis sp. Fse]|nr:MAG: hypothetical protein FKGGLIKP_00343 [Sodalis sp. Fse]
MSIRLEVQIENDYIQEFRQLIHRLQELIIILNKMHFFNLRQAAVSRLGKVPSVSQLACAGMLNLAMLLYNYHHLLTI